jgi:hypothetical protein
MLCRPLHPTLAAAFVLLPVFTSLAAGTLPDGYPRPDLMITPEDVMRAVCAETAAATAPASDASASGGDASRSGGSGGGRLRTFEMPPTVVTGTPSAFKDDELIGSWKQPRWTAQRLFPTTRVYVIPEGEIDVESWTRAQVPRDGKVAWEHRQELEIGLPWRFQIDLYTIERHEGKGTFAFDHAFEVRWAVADWGVIPGNPALYFEYQNRGNGDPEKLEAKLLLGDTLFDGWHWGVNLVYERELGSPFTEEYEVTIGLSRTVIDRTLSLGMEGKFGWANEKGDRSAWGEDLRLGPSIQWRPMQSMHVDFAPLFGLTEPSHFMDIYLVIGLEF